jgi:hypothetical protein
LKIEAQWCGLFGVPLPSATMNPPLAIRVCSVSGSFDAYVGPWWAWARLVILH